LLDVTLVEDAEGFRRDLVMDDGLVVVTYDVDTEFLR